MGIVNLGLANGTCGDSFDRGRTRRVFHARFVKAVWPLELHQAETLFKVILPMASPAILTGVILAVARAAGEVAPLMLVGVVKLAPTLPLGCELSLLALGP